jgi:hypothetical protein
VQPPAFATVLHRAPEDGAGIAVTRRPQVVPTAASVAAVAVVRDEGASVADGSAAGLALLAVALLLLALAAVPWSPRPRYGALAFVARGRTELAAGGVAILAALAVASLLGAG